MGSVAGSVVNHCHCPTLVVKPPQQVTPNVPQGTEELFLATCE